MQHSPDPRTTRRRGGHRTLRTAALLAASAFVLALSSAPVAGYAATGAPQVATIGTAALPATPTTFAVQPAGASGGPGGSDPRPYFSYSVTPGATFVDHAAVHNYGTRPLALTLYAGDAFNTGDGGFDLETAGHTPTGVGAWTTLQSNANAQAAAVRTPGPRSAAPAPLIVTVPARSTAVVAFRIAVPANATPGDHAGGIVASVATQGRDARGDHVTVDERVGARVYLRVSGPLRPALSVVGLHANYQGSANPVGTGRITVDYTVRNTGNVQLSASQLLRASNALGSYAPAHVPGDLPLLLPGGSATFTEQFDHVPPGGLTHVTLSLAARAAPGQHDPALPTIQVGASLWTMPWVALALVVCAIAGSVAWALRRRRRTS